MKKRSQFLKNVLLAVILMAAIVSCKKDEEKPQDPPPVTNEEEIITTMKITFTDVAGIEPTVEAVFSDPDGEGGNPPTVFDVIVLKNNTTYQASILLLNETVSPPDNISEEVEEEGDEHIFCFTSGGVDITVVRTDSDGTYGIGLESEWTTGEPATGTMLIVLKHQPGVKDGTCEPGETDIELLFETVVE